MPATAKSRHLRRILRQYNSIAVCLGLSLFAALPASAQSNLLDLRVVEFDTDGSVTYQNFIYNRWFEDGRFMIEALRLRIPTSDYTEFSIGAGLRAARLGDAELYALAHVAKATDGTYLQPAALIVDAKGRLTGAMFVQHYAPLDDTGAPQWLIDPLEAQFAVVAPLSLGAAAYFYKAPGVPWLRKVGPKASLADRWGATELRVTRTSDGMVRGWETQVRRIFVF
jgi:hypothetical protein